MTEDLAELELKVERLSQLVELLTVRVSELQDRQQQQDDPADVKLMELH